MNDGKHHWVGAFEELQNFYSQPFPSPFIFAHHADYITLGHITFPSSVKEVPHTKLYMQTSS